MLDQNKLSDKAATMIVLDTSRSLGQEAETLALNRSSIRRLRRKHREATAAAIKVSFNPTTALTVHWDGKLTYDLSGTDRVYRLPILVTTMGETKFLKSQKYLQGLARLKSKLRIMP